MRARLAWPLLLAALVAPPLVATPASAAGELDVVQLNVGQGDAALFRAPCGETALLDAGDGSADDVLDQLAAWGTSTIDVAIASHYDSDHLGDLQQLGDARQAGGAPADVGVLVDRGGGAAAKDTQTYATYYDWAQTLGADHVTAEIGDAIVLCTGDEEVSFTVVSVGTDGTAVDGVPVSDENDRGLCFLVEFGDFDMATCGDINGTDDGSLTDVETAAVDDLGNVEVVKVNHHGSANSSNQTYVSALDAEAAIISVGSNSYGHPNTAVVERWQNSGSAVYLTGVDAAGLTGSGDVTLSTDGLSGFAIQTERSDAVQTGGLDENSTPEPEPEPQPEPEPEPEPQPQPQPQPERQPEPAPQPLPQPRAIDDSCPGQIQEDGFGDVAASNPHEAAVDCVVHWQVANGKSASSYAPTEAVNREQMASFIARLVQRAGGNLPAASRDFFADDNTSAHQDSINRLAQAQIVGGKGGATYDPKGGVTRAQMAAFLTRAHDYRAAQAGQGALPVGGDYFPDDSTQPLQPEINKAAAAGFTGGFADGSYRPGEGVRRDQMASFLARVLDLFVQNGMAGVPAPPPPPAPAPAPGRPANPGNTKNCGDFSTWRAAQDWFELYYPDYGDVAELDADNDMIACESLPGAP